MIYSTLIALIGTIPGISVQVDGEGYLRLLSGQNVLYARKATFEVRNGYLATREGFRLAPGVLVPPSAQTLTIDLDGTIVAIGPNARRSTLGRIVLASFPVGTRLRNEGAFLTATQRPRLVNPGEFSSGVIRSSNPGAHIAPVEPDSSPGGNLSVKVRLHSVVDRDEFVLADIADLSGSSAWVERAGKIPFGRSPIYGTDRGLSQSYVSGRIQVSGLRASQFDLHVPSGARIARASNLVEPGEFIRAAVQALEAKSSAKVQWRNVLEVSAMRVPTGSLRLEAEVGPRSGGGTPVVVTAWVDERRIQSRRLRLVPAGGEALVRTGERVRLRLRRNGISVELPAIARSGGMLGERITVETSSGSRHVGTLTEGGTVEVGA